MNMKISPQVQLPPVLSGPSRADTDAGRFRNLVREFEGGKAGPTDFLGAQAPGKAAARTFNAEGFFARVERHLAETEATPVSGLPEPTDAPGSIPADVPVTPNNPSDHPGHDPRPSHLPAAAMKARPGPVLPVNASERAHAVHVALFQAEAPPVEGAPDPAGEDQLNEASPSADPREPTRLGSTPFRAFVDGGSVRIIGPARYLSETEEEALAAEVASLMATHDLGIEDFWFNGRRIMPGQQGAG